MRERECVCVCVCVSERERYKRGLVGTYCVTGDQANGLNFHRPAIGSRAII